MSEYTVSQQIMLGYVWKQYNRELLTGNRPGLWLAIARKLSQVLADSPGEGGRWT